MKGFIKALYNKIILLLSILFAGFLLSFVLADFVNQNRAYYQASFTISNMEYYDVSKLNMESYLIEIKDSASKYENINVSKMIKRNDFTYTVNDNKVTIKTSYKYYDIFFLSSKLNVSTRAKTYIKDVVNGINKDVVIFDNPDDIIETKDYIERYKIGLLGLGISLIIELSIFALLYAKKKININQIEYDEDLFKTSLSKTYWKKALVPITKVRQMTTIAMLFAMMMACKFIPIPSGFGNLGLSFTYLFFSIICMIYGPIYGFVVGIFSDIIGFFINSGGGYFNLGYTLQAALTGFIYGMCFFKKRLTFSRVFLSRILVNYLMNAIMGSILNTIVVYVPQEPSMSVARFIELTKYYFAFFALPKNTLYLLPQTLLLYGVLKAVSPILKRFKLVKRY